MAMRLKVQCFEHIILRIKRCLGQSGVVGCLVFQLYFGPDFFGSAPNRGDIFGILRSSCRVGVIRFKMG